MEYIVNDRTIRYHAQGETAWGDNRILLEHAADLTAGTWAAAGFTIQKFLDDALYAHFESAAYRQLIACWQEAGLPVNDYFPLQHYHTLAADWTTHLKALDKTKLLPVHQFPVPIAEIETRISQICGVPLVAHNPFDGQRVYHYRIIRPHQGDNNPLHRDVWLEDYDDCINLYIPIAGSDERSSLVLLPGSHRWNESRVQRTVAGAHINGVRFNVPAVTAIDGPFTIQRSSPAKNEVLVFSPYLVHGGAVNLNDHTTRISIELRLWRRL